jgi:hypothetical protein
LGDSNDKRSKDETMGTYFTCGVKGCGHVQPVDRPEDILRFDTCKNHMISHYKWDHADMIGTKVSTPGVAFSDYYKYRPIPDNIGPVLTDNDDTYTWADIKKYFG